MSNVVISIRGPEPDTAVQTLDLGEFRAVWDEGISIGSHPECTVVLPELPSVAGWLFAGSNHRFLHHPPDGTSPEALPPESRFLDPYRRVDNRDFNLGPYRIHLGKHTPFRELDAQIDALAAIDPRAAMWCVVACLRTAMGELDSTPSVEQAIEAIGAWARGVGSVEGLQRARDVLQHPDDRPTRAASYAVQTALALAEGTTRHDGYTAPFRAIVHGLPEARRDPVLEVLIALIDAQHWPLCSPGREALHTAPSTLAVAWDSVDHAHTEQTIAELRAAHARSQRLALDWSDPLQRAIAERADNEERLQMLLSTR